MATKPDGPIVTRSIPPLSLRASIAPASLDEEARTVELTWTTGARVLRGYYDKFYEELSTDPKHVRMGRLENGAPLLNSHRGWDLSGVIGVVVSASIKKGEGRAVVRFARGEDDPAADAIFRKVRDGIIRNVSVGYRILRMEKVQDGDEEIPVFRATDWEPFEISMVPMGADAGAGVRGDGPEPNPCEFVLCEERGMSKMKTDPESTNTPDAASRGDAGSGGGQTGSPAAAPAPAVDERALREQAALAERKRIADIQRIGRSLGVGDELVKRAIDDASTVEAFRAAAQDAFAAGDPLQTGIGARIDAGPDARDKWLRGAGDWLIQRAAVDGMVVEAAKKRGAADEAKLDPGEFRGMSLVELARQALERAGVRTAGMLKMDIVGRALTMRSGGMQATGDFPVLLENVMHKVLLAAYATAPDTWSLFCATGTVADFRPHHRVRMGGLGRLELVNEHGEFKNQTIRDGEKESIYAVTKGNIVALTRQSLINDDMGAFSRVATMLGRAARLSIEADVYDLIGLNAGLGPVMGDTKTLFHDDHDNVGEASELSVAGLDGDRVTMASQMDPSGNDFLDLRPEILLVPIGLGGQARQINEAQYDVTQGAVSMSPNIVRGLFRTVVDTPRLTGVRRYLLASPSVAPTFEVVFLDGQQTPYLETKDGWRVDGVEWKTRLDYGVGAVDWRGAVTNEGEVES